MKVKKMSKKGEEVAVVGRRQTSTRCCQMKVFQMKVKLVGGKVARVATK
jgi:hypothetical protein